MVPTQPLTQRSIPSAGPSITEKEIQYVTDAIRHGWYENMGKYITEFESGLASYVGKKYALATSNCTAAIHLSLQALGIKPGDEVIVPDITWVASAAPICYVGATPVFADIDRKNWCLSAETIEKRLTKNTKAIVLVGIYGNLPKMEEILSLVQKHDIPILEDAAESIGAEYKGRKAGSFGDVGVFSFNGTKLLVTGEGGMLATDDKEIYERCKVLGHHGMHKGPGAKLFWSWELGNKYQFTNLQAALGLAQLSRIEELVTKRRELFAWYRERLSDMEGLEFNYEEPGVKSTYWVVTLVLGPQYKIGKEELMAKMAEHKIAIRPFFYPLSSMPTFASYCRGRNMTLENPVSYDLSPRSISLPSAASLTREDVDYVCDVFREILKKSRR